MPGLPPGKPLTAGKKPPPDRRGGQVGPGSAEALRALKRRLSDIFYRKLLADAASNTARHVSQAA
jgi:hypothetical protein